jgi:hypothetical protein
MVDMLAKRLYLVMGDCIATAKLVSMHEVTGHILQYDFILGPYSGLLVSVHSEKLMSYFQEYYISRTASVV